MKTKEENKLSLSLHKLKAALKNYENGPDSEGVKFLAVAKAFEIAVEYAWKELKKRVEDEGIDVITPKEAIRQAAKINLISNAESWLNYITARNSGVHDYFGISESHYLELVRSFLKESKKL